MAYQGKLYGRFGNKYFDTGKTSEDWGVMENKVKSFEWVEIKSEEDLPEHGGEYHVFKNGLVTKAIYAKSNRWLAQGNDYPKTTETHGITHYQKIVTPSPPKQKGNE